jgi:predicted dehydrogenase
VAENSETAANTKQFGWGIIGTGRIARDFASDLRFAHGAKLVAVLSREQKSAEEFCTNAASGTAYCDMDRFMADPAIDIVYVASPNNMHLPQALRAIRAGKAVLVEKPLAPSETEAAVIAREAARTGTLVMEAMWIAFLPGIMAVKKLIQDGAIGEVRSISGALSYKNEFDPQSRLFNKAMGGGALLDLGVYLLSLTMQIMGEPKRISGSWTAAPSGVDGKANFQLQYDDAVADLTCGITETLHNSFDIIGTKGHIRISDPFIRARRVEISTGVLSRKLMMTFRSGFMAKLASRLPLPGHQVLRFDDQGLGLSYQAVAMMDALRAGKTSVDAMPLASSAAVLRAIDLLLSHSPQV